jgi:ABC-type multidrug transport system fused ATPase/permease subunit
MMPQNPYIFNRTVKYNVRYTDLDATDEGMHEACRKAGIHKTIMARKYGYETLTGDNGQWVTFAAAKHGVRMPLTT